MLLPNDYRLVLALGHRRYRLLPPGNRHLTELCEPSAEIVEVDFTRSEPTETLSA